MDELMKALHVKLPASLYDRLEDYWHERRLPSRSSGAAIHRGSVGSCRPRANRAGERRAPDCDRWADAMSASLTDRILREIQAEMRTVGDENKLIREELGAKASRGELLGVLQALADRIAAFEAAALTRVDQTERNVQERLGRIETTLIDVARKLDA